MSKGEHIFSNTWGNKCLFANGAGNARGVATLFNSKVAKGIQDIERDIDGRYLICKVVIDEYSYCIANIYAPNEDSPQFFRNIFNKIREMDCVFQIIGGDFNVALNPELDRGSEIMYNRNAREIILQEMENDGEAYVDNLEGQKPRCERCSRG